VDFVIAQRELGNRSASGYGDALAGFGDDFEAARETGFGAKVLFFAEYEGGFVARGTCGRCFYGSDYGAIGRFGSRVRLPEVIPEFLLDSQPFRFGAEGLV